MFSFIFLEVLNYYHILRRVMSSSLVIVHFRYEITDVGPERQKPFNVIGLIRLI